MSGTTHRVVSGEQWLTERQALLAKEKEFTRLRDELNRQRRELPWVKVDRPYSFDGPRGSEKLADLFQGRSQLVVYHFMFAPEWEAGCKHCSFWADHFDPMGIHLKHRDIAFAAISRAPLAKIEAFKRRMGWKFKWVSSGGNDFNYDFAASYTEDQQRDGGIEYNYRREKPMSGPASGKNVREWGSRDDSVPVGQIAASAGTVAKAINARG